MPISFRRSLVKALTNSYYKFNRRLNDVNLKVIFKAPDNDVTHYITTKRRHPKVSNNTIKNLGALQRTKPALLYCSKRDRIVIVLLRSPTLFPPQQEVAKIIMTSPLARVNVSWLV